MQIFVMLINYVFLYLLHVWLSFIETYLLLIEVYKYYNKNNDKNSLVTFSNRIFYQC